MTFFSSDEVTANIIKNGRTLGCPACKLYKQANSPKMEPYGNFKKKILNIGKFPNDIDDNKGKPFQGKTGRRLERVYREMGINLFDDCLNINAINCHPPDNRDPKPFEIDCCRVEKVESIITKYKPKVIVALGDFALQSLIGEKWKKDLGAISKWRGFIIPDFDYKCWIAPVYHPDHVGHDGGVAIETIWKQDLKKALEHANKPLPGKINANIKIIKDLKQLEKFNSLSSIAFDYETTGLKPYAKGHRIISCSIAVSPEDVVAFMMPETRYDRRPLMALLSNPGIGKRAHNLKFEETWTKIRLRTQIKNWEWDSMLAAHLLDNRPGITGLKFQTYVNFGVPDYSSKVESYLKGNNKNDNSLNKIQELIKSKDGQFELLHYNAWDSIYEYQLSMKQIETIEYDYLPF
ncbi:MAG: uracil-DNA glycosylase family protein [Cyclobacteriaceae bacterium]